MFPAISKWVLTKLSIKFNRGIHDMSKLRFAVDKIVPLLIKNPIDQFAAEPLIADRPSASKAVESLESEDTNFPGHEILPPVSIQIYFITILPFSLTTKLFCSIIVNNIILTI